MILNRNSFANVGSRTKTTVATIGRELEEARAYIQHLGLAYEVKPKYR